MRLLVKPVYTLFGVFDAYVLVVIHLGTHKVFCSPPTYSPDSAWVVQQARNAAMWLDDLGVTPRFIIHDADTKFDARFKHFWKSSDVQPIQIPIAAPRANAYCEAFIGSIKRECLNSFICFSCGQLDYLVRIWLAHYNGRRPHRGIGMNNEVLDKSFVPQTHGAIRCRRQLGGIIKDYYRDAA